MLRRLGIGTLSAFAVLALSLGGCSDDDGRAMCGNDVIEGTESCDTNQLGGETCETQGNFTGGTLACTNFCGFDTSGCTNVTQTCNNGTVEGTEYCDGTDLDGNDCTDLGFTGGDLACNSDCTFDDSDCNDLCGNGSLNVTSEICDDIWFGSATCANQGNFDGGTLTCSADCQTITTTNCCTDACTTDGDTSCNGTVLETCEVQTNGCLGLTTYDCADDTQICDDSAATAICADACTATCTAVDETRCMTNSVETCIDDAGCLTWQVTDACTAGSEVCVQAGTTATCLASGGADSCVDAEVILSSVTLSGTDFYVDFTDSNDWQPNTGCGYANGPDAVFQVWLDVGEVVHYRQSGDLDGVIRVLDTCDATSDCLVSLDDYASGSTEEGAYPATSAGYYWVVVEGYSSTGPDSYDILIEVLPDEVDCGDASDNDRDGLEDCDDPNCFGDTTHCTTETNCTDGQDNDGDNDIDCADSDCDGVGFCEATETSCDDSNDNDRDGDTDCADSDCATAPVCQNMIATYEIFGSSSLIDVSGCTIAFTPDATTYQYTSVCNIGGLPITPGSGSVDATTLTLTDDSAVEITLQGTWTIPFYGNNYSSIWVGSNGWVTFGAGDTSMSGYFMDLPRIAGFSYDLNPGSGGTVTVDENADHIVVTFDNVPEYGGSDVVTFQIVIYSNGNIDLHYDTADIADSSIVGIGNGGALGSTPPATNFVLLPGDLVITEIMYHPSLDNTLAEWVEVYNPNNYDINLDGCTFADNSNSHTFVDLVIPANTHFVLTRNDDDSVNGGITGSYAVGSAMALNNAAGDIVTIACGTTTVAEVDFRGWSIGDTGSAAIQLSNLLTDETNNDLEASWCEAVDTYGTTTDFGTPGVANNDCGATTVLLTEDFTGGVPPTGWSIVDGGDVGTTWGVCGGTCGLALTGGTGEFALIDSDAAGTVPMDDELITLSVDCTGYTTCQLSFLHYFVASGAGDFGDVDVSINAGAWTNIVSYTTDSSNGENVSVAIPGAGGQSDVRIRFRYVGNYDYWWLIDDVSIIGIL